MAQAIGSSRRPFGAGAGRGCPVDEVGRVYGRWTVVERAPSPVLRRNNRNDPAAFWRCVCVCGNEGVVRGHQLRCGQSRSCGCYRRDRTREAVSLPSGVSGANRALANTKSNAARRGYSWGLTKEHALSVMAGNCVYCGDPPKQVSRGRNGKFVYNGIDRVNNDIGYEVGNVVACCGVCNTAKMRMSVDEFYCWIAKIYNHAKLAERE